MSRDAWRPVGVVESPEVEAERLPVHMLKLGVAWRADSFRNVRLGFSEAVPVRRAAWWRRQVRAYLRAAIMRGVDVREWCA